MEPETASLKQRILSFFSSKPRRRFSLKEIQKVIDAEPDAVAAVLKTLTREGTLVRLKKSHYALPGGQGILIGRVQGCVRIEWEGAKEWDEDMCRQQGLKRLGRMSMMW